MVETPAGGRCAECRREYQRAYRERRRTTHPDYFKRYYRENREARSRESREYAHRHAGANRERARRWERENRERANATKRQYRHDNPDYVRRWNDWINWRARGDNAPDANALAFSAILRRDPCCYCGSPTAEIDHIEPMIGGGGNVWSNLTGSCRLCNRRKSAKPLLTFLLDLA